MLINCKSAEPFAAKWAERIETEFGLKTFSDDLVPSIWVQSKTGEVSELELIVTGENLYQRLISLYFELSYIPARVRIANARVHRGHDQIPL